MTVHSRKHVGGEVKNSPGRAVPRTQVRPLGDSEKLDEDRWRVVRHPWIDELAHRGDPDPQDEGLRRLVDALPEQESHLVERVYFGGSTAKDAGEEIGLTPSVSERLLKSGLARLGSWIEDAPATDKRKPKQTKVKKVRCSAAHKKHGRCQQPAFRDSYCKQHLEWIEKEIAPDATYEGRVFRGEVTPAVAVLSETEIRTMMEGRFRGDGRRLDAYAPTESEGQTSP